MPRLRATVELLICFLLYTAVDFVAAQSRCTPSCSAGETCRQVLNTNNQYECVTSFLAPSPATSISNNSAPSSQPSSSPLPAGCTNCFNSQVCEQVFNSNQYHCVTASSASAPSVSSIPAACQSCSSSQTCQQVYNSNQYHCVNNTASAPAPVPSIAVAVSPTISNTSSSNTSPCNEQCSEQESCEQVYNSKQYACTIKRSPTSPTALTAPAASNSNTSATTSPAVATSPNASNSASPGAGSADAGLSGDLQVPGS